MLLVLYSFPPSHSIGARRWAKFSKYLTQLNFELFVITSKEAYSQNGSWWQDINNERIKIIRISSFYPSFLSKSPKSIFARVLKKIGITAIKLFYSGIPFDEGIFWKQNLRKTIENVAIQNSIETIICSGPPYSLFRQCIKVKKKLGSKLIFDLRDPWIKDNVYGYSSISHKMKQFEESRMIEAFQNADLILTPYKKLIEDFECQFVGKINEKLIHLPHAYDSDDYKNYESQEKQIKPFLFVYAGSTRNCYDKILKPLANSIWKYQQTTETRKLEFKFYINNLEFESFVNKKGLNKIIKVERFIPEEELMKKQFEADFLMILQAPYKDYLSTKCFNLLPFCKPIIYLGEEGRISKFLEENKFGIRVNPSQFQNDLQMINELKIDFESNLNSRNISRFSYKVASKKLAEILKKV